MTLAGTHSVKKIYTYTLNMLKEGRKVPDGQSNSMIENKQILTRLKKD